MVRTVTPWGVFDPIDPPEVAALFSALEVPWWIAAGYAIELALGRSFREHQDIDILMLRRDQGVIFAALPGWECWAADPPGTLRPWLPGEVLPPDVHDIWCRRGPDDPWRLQFMLDESEDDEWVSRKDPTLRRPLRELGARSADGIPYVRPEVQLFYKAGQLRPKDEQDFTEILPSLSEAQRAWLADAIKRVYGHRSWLDRLG